MTKRVNNIICKSVEKTDLKETQLSIQINLDGFSFCVHTLDQKELLVFQRFEFDQKVSTPENHLKEIEKIYESNEFLSQKFHKVIVIHQNELATVVPQELFDENHLKDYLKHTVKVLPIDYISSEPIEQINAHTAYIPFVNINNFLFTIYGSFEYFHSFTKLTNRLFNEDKKNDFDKIFIQVNNRNFELIAFKNHQLQLINRFEFLTAEDFIYYILFSAEQLEFDPETLRLVLMGDIEQESELFSILYTYIRHISFYQSNEKLAKEGFQNLPKHANFLLFE